MKLRWFSLAVVLAALGCGAAPVSADPSPAAEPAVAPPAQPAPVEPAPAADPGPAADPAATLLAGWDAVLSTYVTADGGFRYTALAASADDMAKLSAYVAWVESADVSGFSRDQKLAFYINAYNATTIAAVLKLWPVESVLKVPGFFDTLKHRFAGEELTLNDLESKKIREPYGEPRIHFLVNCASASCPVLVGRAITADNLESLLDAQTTSYIRATSRIDRHGRKVEISSIFDWYKADFGGDAGVRAFVSARLEGDDAAFVAAAGTRIAFFNYDWSLNAR
jgi:hypothetical protein